MSGERKFGISAMGFNKSDVNAYIERILSEFDARLKEKDGEISNLKMQIREMKARYETVSMASHSLSKDKEQIASALITAQQTANKIIEDAKSKAQIEKDQLEQTLEKDREKIIDIKRDVKAMKSNVAEMLAKFQEMLNDAEESIDNKAIEYLDSEEIE